MAVVAGVHNMVTEGSNVADLSRILSRTGFLTSLLKQLDATMMLLVVAVC